MNMSLYRKQRRMQRTRGLQASVCGSKAMHRGFLVAAVVLCLQQPTMVRTQQFRPQTSNAWGTGDNVLAAIDHYGKRIEDLDATANDYKHLSTALRFAGRLKECAYIIHRGVMRVPEYATGANYFLLGNVLRAEGRVNESVGAYEVIQDFFDMTS